MRTVRLLLPRGQVLLAIDLFLAVWVAGWIWLGVAVGQQVSGLRRLSGTAERAGAAARESGKVLSTLGGVPLVGGDVGRTGHQVEAAGNSAIESARISRKSVGQLSWMLALAIALIPSTPVLGLYLPARIGVARNRRSLLQLWSASAEDPALRELLAERALATLPYHRPAWRCSPPGMARAQSS